MMLQWSQIKNINNISNQMIIIIKNKHKLIFASKNRLQKEDFIHKCMELWWL